MDSDILKEAGSILSGIIDSRDRYLKVAIVLKMIPIESFDEAFRFFSNEDQQKILQSLDKPGKICSIESCMVVYEFLRKNDLMRFLKTSTQLPEEILAVFQKYAAKHPRKISGLLYDTWLKGKGEEK